MLIQHHVSFKISIDVKNDPRIKNIWGDGIVSEYSSSGIQDNNMGLCWVYL